MLQFHSESEIKVELDSSEFQNKLPAFSGRNYPIEYLSSREFEILTYFIFKREIGLGVYTGQFDTILLMKGTAERGRDCILQNKNKNVGVIQCKRYTNLISKPDLAREIIKFVLHSIQDKDLITDVTDFTYYFVALQGFRETAIALLQDFNKKILLDLKLKEWALEVLDENSSLKFKKYEDVKVQLENILGKIKVKPITGQEIDQKLKNAKEIITMFFEVEKVANEDMLRKVFGEFFEFKSDADLEKLRQKLKDIPKENRMFFGVFSIYGYDMNFYKKILNDKKLPWQIADVKVEINNKFIQYLNDTINKYSLLFVSGIRDISPFTKQVVTPYLFQKYALKHSESSMGEFLSGIAQKNLTTTLHQSQTIEDHKKYLLDIGDKVLRNDFSTFVGNEELLKLKKDVALWIHSEFKSVEEMSSRFDADMLKLMPIIDAIEKEIIKIMPINPTIIIENNGLGNSKEDFLELMKNVQKYDEKK